LLITDKKPKQIDKYQELDVDNFDFVSFYQQLDVAGKQSFLLLTNDPAYVLKHLKKKLTYIKAAGGLVENAEGQLLFIHRNGKWDLPKGKVEPGEKVKIAAIREVEEECGLEVKSRDYRITKTYHVYPMDGQIVLKRTTWYKMSVSGVPSLVPQQEEGISQAIWVARHEVDEKMKNTYPSIIDVIKAKSPERYRLFR